MLFDSFITKVLDDIAKKEGFVDYVIDSQKGSNHGDNFLGIITAIKMCGRRAVNGKSETLHLLCKAPPSNESRRENFKSGLVFARETYIYSKLLPAFVKFQQEKGLNDNESFLSFPKVYACISDEENDKYLLVMEDLRSKNYQMWPKNKTIAYDHAEKIMKELGKFHAVSFAMKDQRPDEFSEYKKLTDNFSELLTNGKLTVFIKKTIERAANALKDPELRQMMLDFRYRYGEMLDEIFAMKSCDPFGVVGHGDSWNNNFLFQYNDNTNRLQSVCFLDFQIARYCSPVLDLHYNLFTGTDKVFREAHYEDLLKIYHESVSQTIRKLGSDPEKLFSYDDFQRELRKFGEFPLLFGPMIIQIRIAEAADILDLDEYSERVDKGELDADLLGDFNEENQIIYNTLINDLVNDLIKYKFIKLK